MKELVIDQFDFVEYELISKSGEYPVAYLQFSGEENLNRVKLAFNHELSLTGNFRGLRFIGKIYEFIANYNSSGLLPTPMHTATVKILWDKQIGDLNEKCSNQ
jgi:hypothetical protein